MCVQPELWPASLRASVHASRDYKEEEHIANNDKVRLLPLVRLATGSISPTTLQFRKPAASMANKSRSPIRTAAQVGPPGVFISTRGGVTIAMEVFRAM